MLVRILNADRSVDRCCQGMLKNKACTKTRLCKADIQDSEALWFQNLHAAQELRPLELYFASSR